MSGQDELGGSNCYVGPVENPPVLTSYDRLPPSVHPGGSSSGRPEPLRQVHIKRRGSRAGKKVRERFSKAAMMGRGQRRHEKLQQAQMQPRVQPLAQQGGQAEQKPWQAQREQREYSGQQMQSQHHQKQQRQEQSEHLGRPSYWMPSPPQKQERLQLQQWERELAQREQKLVEREKSQIRENRERDRKEQEQIDEWTRRWVAFEQQQAPAQRYQSEKLSFRAAEQSYRHPPGDEPSLRRPLEDQGFAARDQYRHHRSPRGNNRSGSNNTHGGHSSSRHGYHQYPHGNERSGPGQPKHTHGSHPREERGREFQSHATRDTYRLVHQAHGNLDTERVNEQAFSQYFSREDHQPLPRYTHDERSRPPNAYHR